MTVLTPQLIEKYIAEFNYQYIKQFLSNLLASQCQQKFAEITEKLDEFKEKYPSFTEEEKEEYSQIVKIFEDTSSQIRKALDFGDNAMITHDEVLNYLEILQNRYDDPDFIDYIKEEKTKNNPVSEEVVKKIIKLKQTDDKHIRVAMEKIVFPEEQQQQMEEE